MATHAYRFARDRRYFACDRDALDYLQSRDGHPSTGSLGVLRLPGFTSG